MRQIAFAFFLLTLWLASSPAHASVANAPGANLEVALISYGPGETYWERFGHDAIEIRDTVSGEAVSFNYGVFDFNEANFFVNFARGRMHYRMDAAPSSLDESFYVDAGRSITRQPLAFDAKQAEALRDFLLWNLRPENAGYNYDYYEDNCTTRVRDALNHALGGILATQIKPRAGGMTYRQQTVRLMSDQPWLMLVLDLGLGPYADQPLDAWQESFLPEVLQSQLRLVSVKDSRAGQRPLVQGEQLVSANRLQPAPAAPPDLRLPMAIGGLFLAALLSISRRRWPTGFVLLGSVYLTAAGLIGIVLLALWSLTSHHAAWANANLLLFNPLALLLLPTLWRAPRGLRPSRFIDSVIAIQLLGCMISALLHLFSGHAQQNQPWLLFALPVWLAVAWSVRHRR